MEIRDIFEDDINRKINGVIMVEQDTESIIKQEVQEYVITKELKKHFISFFDKYSDAFDKPTSEVGVWISGFFGSGKSHFLKMLSYILENKIIDGITTVERFRSKFIDDPATFMMIDKSTKNETETILFNIDSEGSITKDKTVVLRVFAKMFLNHLGFYGENLRVAMLERYIEESGKTDEFRRVFEEKKGKSWLDQRRAFAFNGKAIVSTLMEVLDMDEKDAWDWYKSKTNEEYSISLLVNDVKAYVDTKPEDFRLLFMIDEVGQYVGTDIDLLSNLQSIVEEFGRACKGKVWVICTGQEAVDEIIKVRADEFSRIQARFKTLSLSSSSVEEVIQKRILKKKSQCVSRLEQIYSENDSTLRNLYTFNGAILDIKGYEGPQEFIDDFPFVPYQFIIMQKVFTEIRKHGAAGKHLSGGERSMLSGFQEAAQRIQEKDEYALVPLHLFYDTVHGFLDSSIRRVIERCQKAADSNKGIKQKDVSVLELLYLIRYVDDIPANLDNIVILMADDIRTDKIVLREQVRGSLDRLYSQNYIGRNGDIYNFLTDEEQDVAKEIRNTNVDTSAIVTQLGKVIFGDIYTTKKYHYGKYDFSFDQMVDGMMVGANTGSMRLRVLTVATDTIEKSELRLLTTSKGQALIVLSDAKYYESLENAMKIRKYVRQHNVSQLPASMQAIIKRYQDEADTYETASRGELEEAIVNAEYYVDGEHIAVKGGNAKYKIDQALEYLVGHVYNCLEMIAENAETDADIYAILRKQKEYHPGTDPNQEAAAKVEEYLEVQQAKKLPTSMSDIQSRYQAVPYGWREIDIATVVARLIVDQKVTIKYAGNTIQPNNPKLPDMLRKKSEVGKTIISKRLAVSVAQMREAKDFLREYFDIMDVPADEDGLIAFIIKKFIEQKDHYNELDKRYSGHTYPDHAVVLKALELTEDVLSQQKDNIALIQRLLKNEDALYDNKERMQNVEAFFKNQVQLFDAAVKLNDDLMYELDQLAKEPEANEALNQIRLICVVQHGNKFDYKKIPELNALMVKVQEGHNRLLATKREELSEILRQCMEAVHMAADGVNDADKIIRATDNFYEVKQQNIADYKSLALLDGLIPPMLQKKDEAVERLEALSKAKSVAEDDENNAAVFSSESNAEKVQPKKKVYKQLNRSVVFPSKRIEGEDGINDYVEKMRATLLQLLSNCDGIDLK